MNRKDIALTVAGVLATMALAYLFYRQQQQSAAVQAATTSQDVTSPGYDDGGLYDSSMQYQYAYASQLASASVPTLSATSSNSAVANSVDTSASTAATGNEPTSDGESLISQILAEFHTSNNGSSGVSYSPSDYSSLLIPTIDTQPVVTTTGIPITAADAASDADNMLAVNTGGLTSSATNAVPAPSTQAPSTVATPASQASPLHYNHILSPQLNNQIPN